MIVVRMISVNHDVDADAEPRQPHDDEQLGEQGHLLAGVGVHQRLRNLLQKDKEERILDYKFNLGTF